VALLNGANSCIHSIQTYITLTIELEHLLKEAENKAQPPDVKSGGEPLAQITMLPGFPNKVNRTPMPKSKITPLQDGKTAPPVEPPIILEDDQGFIVIK